MTENELKKLSRTDLLEMLLRQSTELKNLKDKLEKTETELHRKELAIDTAGSIAEASLQLNGIFEAAEASCEQYIENIRLLSERQEAICLKRDMENRENIEREVADTKQKCETMKAETEIKCAEMVKKAQAESEAYWKEVSDKLEKFYDAHAGLRELLSVISSPHR